MAIDTSGEYWTGSDAEDVLEYLLVYEAEGYPIDETRLCKCACGSIEFSLNADRDEGVAERTCAACGIKHLICDSADHWESAEPELWKCECGSKTCNLGVAFSLYEAETEDKRNVRWISIGERCTNCGILSSSVDWKIGYGPSQHLLEQA